MVRCIGKAVWNLFVQNGVYYFRFSNQTMNDTEVIVCGTLFRLFALVLCFG